MSASRLREVQTIVSAVRCLDYTFHVSLEGEHIFIQLSYMDLDIDTGAKTKQKSRRWLVESDDSETKIVETCFAAALRSMHHRTAEWFLYQGSRVYSPHFHITARIHNAAKGDFDE